MYPQSLFCVALASVVLAGPLNARKEYAVRDSHIVPPGWKRIDRVPSDHYINLHIGLRQSGFDELERTLYQGILHAVQIDLASRPHAKDKQYLIQPMIAMVNT